jgi:hypothetical protein
MLYGFAGDLPMAFGILSFAASGELCNNLKYIMIFILFATSFEVRRGMHWASELIIQEEVSVDKLVSRHVLKRIHVQRTSKITRTLLVVLNLW